MSLLYRFHLVWSCKRNPWNILILWFQKLLQLFLMLIGWPLWNQTQIINGESVFSSIKMLLFFLNRLGETLCFVFMLIQPVNTRKFSKCIFHFAANSRRPQLDTIYSQHSINSPFYVFRILFVPCLGHKLLQILGNQTRSLLRKYKEILAYRSSINLWTDKFVIMVCTRWYG